MLEILMGRANTGKSGRVLEQIRRRGEAGGQSLLLVPEHASHEAEAELCRACGPAASRYAEVLSPRLLAGRVLAVTGGLADGTLDAGGKLLIMQMALQDVLQALTVYARPSRKAPFLREMVELCDELLACRVEPEALGAAVPALEGMSGEKVRDLSVIYAAYLARLRQGGGDRRDLVSKLLERLEESGYVRGKAVYLDGFSWFTGQEMALIGILLRQAERVTVTLLGDGSGREPFQQALQTRDRLVRLAGEAGVRCRLEELRPPEPRDALEHLTAHCFGPLRRWEGDASQVCLYRADTACHEAEYVASEILALVRTGRYRFRDIAVAVRDLDGYAATVENVFRRYGVPVYLSRRSDVLEKPVLCLLTGALDAVAGGYEYEDMFRWLKTGLAGLTEDECDRLEDYVIRWDIHGAMWTRDQDWTANPDGWQEGFSTEQAEALAALNDLRRRVGGPLSRLAQGMREQAGARDKLAVLWAFLEELDLARQLEERTARLEELGEMQRAMEYGQLWELLCGVMDQFADILGDAPLDTEEFTRLMELVLTQYDVATIPVSLDEVQVYQLTRNDRRRVKCLFLMGANDHVLPMVSADTGLLSREDRQQLAAQGVELAPSGEALFHMELEDIYAALAKPTDRLTVTWPIVDPEGAPLRPSFVVGRIRGLLPNARTAAETGDRAYRLTAPIPALELAGGERGGALWRYLAAGGRFDGALAAMERAAEMGRGRLSTAAVEALYGRSYRMSASRVEKVGSCHFAYFMQYGLRARERAPEGFDPAQVGTFLHYVLENVTGGAMARGGFAQLADGELDELLDGAVRRYMETSMPGFEQRDERSKYLFRRLRKTVGAIVENVAEELAVSDFVPMEFELGFGGTDGKLPAITIHAPEASLTVTGKVDRVDGWLKDGKLYLRVVDYKSGRKAFDLRDVRCGLNIQMLLYLFALERDGAAYFGREVVPAGVMYLPARDVLVPQRRGAGREEIRAALDKELRRTGLVLGEPEVLRAMEHSSLQEARFLPLSLGRGGDITKGVATAAQLGKLGRYVDKLLERIARELSAGVIDADPHGHSENETACTYCEFAPACHFTDGEGTDRLEIVRPVTQAEFWAHVDAAIGEEGRA